MKEDIEQHNEKLKVQVDDRMKEIIEQDNLLRTVNSVASKLLASGVDEFGFILADCLQMLGESVDADRVYIWENFKKDGELYCTQIHEWSGGALPQQGNSLTVDLPYSEIPTWEEKLSAGKSISGLVKNLSKLEQEQLEPQGIISILVVPVFFKNEFWGFVGFDDCTKEREYTKSQEAILRSGSLLIATAMLRTEMTKELIRAQREALISTQAKSNFLANMSHEIRTPINAITGMAHIARTTEDKDKINSSLTKIETASKQLLSIINDVLDMSKIEANKIELEEQPFNLISEVHNIHSIAGVQAADKNQKMSIDISPSVPEVVIGDSLRLSQIFLNLLSNAVKFTPNEGEIKLSLSCEDADNGMCLIRATVSDTGIGISDQQKENLFKAFEQASKDTTRLYGGSGLGLAISRRIARLMNGDITVCSEPSKGSCFTVEVYLKRTDELLDSIDKNKNIDSYDFSGHTALLVEDIEINREIAIALLEPTGISIETAADGEQAVEKYKSSPEKFDIILMDIHMPVMDGYKATIAIRGLDIEGAKTIPVLAMTANAFSEDIKLSKEAGMDDHIAKPIDVDEMLAKIERHLNNN